MGCDAVYFIPLPAIVLHCDQKRLMRCIKSEKMLCLVLTVQSSSNKASTWDSMSRHHSDRAEIHVVNNFSFMRNDKMLSRVHWFSTCNEKLRKFLRVKLKAWQHCMEQWMCTHIPMKSLRIGILSDKLHNSSNSIRHRKKTCRPPQSH